MSQVPVQPSVTTGAASPPAESSSGAEQGARSLSVLAALIFLAFCLRVYRLDYQSLWRDEVDAVLFASRSLSELAAMFGKVGENGPLYFLALRGWITLVGASEFAIRFPSVCFSVLAVLLTYRLGREVVSHDLGLIGATVMAVSPYHIWYGQEAKMYALISFLAPLSLLLLLRAVRGGSRWLWLAWAVLMGLFLYIHLFAVMMALVAIAWLAALLRRRPRLTPASGLAATLVVLASLPVARWLLPAALTPAETGYYRYGLAEMVSILFHNFSMGLRPAAGLWPALLFLALLLLGCVPIVAQTKSEKPSEVWQAPRARSVLLLLLYLLVPLLAIWLVSLRRPTFTDRYLIIALPAFSLLIASGILVGGRTIALLMGQKAQKQALEPNVQMERPGEQRGRRRRIAATRVGERYGLERQGAAVPVAPAGARHLHGWLSMVLLGLVILVSLPFVWAQTHNPYKADFRAAARYITERAGPDDLFVFLMPYVQRGFAYYHAQPVRAVEPPYTRDMSQAQVDATLGAQTADSRRVWLFLSEQEFWDPQGLIAMWFDRHAARRCQEFFAYIEVRCYDMR